jgi:hypothetical protein
MGDYVGRVWDIWYADPQGALFVIDSKARKKNERKKESNAVLSVSHISISKIQYRNITSSMRSTILLRITLSFVVQYFFKSVGSMLAFSLLLN